MSSEVSSFESLGDRSWGDGFGMIDLDSCIFRHHRNEQSYELLPDTPNAKLFEDSFITRVQASLAEIFECCLVNNSQGLPMLMSFLSLEHNRFGPQGAIFLTILTLYLCQSS